MAASGRQVLVEDYSPTFSQGISKAYRICFAVLAAINIILGIILIVLGSIMCNLSSPYCHIWTGIPLVVGGCLAILPCATKSKKFAILYLVVAFVLMVVCAAGAINGGVKYWTKYWGLTRLSLDNNRCRVENGKCICETMARYEKIRVPASMDSCDDLETLGDLLITVMAFDFISFMVCLVGVFVAVMAVCCGKWSFVQDYKKENDPDFGASVVHKGTTNKGYSS